MSSLRLFGILAAHVGVVLLIACPPSDPRSSTTGSASSSASTGMGGAGGAMSSVGSSVVASSSSGTGGNGGEGGKLPPHPVDCAHLNPGITCVEDRDCPYMTKEQLAVCGPWSCVWDPPPDHDAGIAGKRGCKLAR